MIRFQWLQENLYRKVVLPFLGYFLAKELHGWLNTRRKWKFKHKNIRRKRVGKNIQFSHAEFQFRMLVWGVRKFRTVDWGFRTLNSGVRNCPSAWCSCLPKSISSSFQLQIIYGLNRWILDFLSFEMVYRMQKMDFGKCSKSALKDCSCVPCFHPLFSSSPLFLPCKLWTIKAKDYEAP